jgi:hypothetical protein
MIHRFSIDGCVPFVLHLYCLGLFLNGRKEEEKMIIGSEGVGGELNLS